MARRGSSTRKLTERRKNFLKVKTKSATGRTKGRAIEGKKTTPRPIHHSLGIKNPGHHRQCPLLPQDHGGRHGSVFQLPVGFRKWEPHR